MARKDIEAGRAFVRFQTRGRGSFEKAMISAQLKFHALAAAGKAAGAAIASGFRTATSAIPNMVGEFAAAGDKFDKMSKRSRVSVEALSELKFAAEQSGTSIESLNAALTRSGRRIANAATGTGPAVRAMKELGLNAAEVAQQPMEEQFLTLVDALGDVSNEFRAGQLGFEVFGDNWRDLAPLLAEGSEGIEKLRMRARELGLTMSGPQTAAAAAVTDATNETSKAFDALRQSIGAEFAPVALFVQKSLTGIIQVVQKIVKVSAVGFNLFIQNLSQVGGAVGFFVDSLGAIGTKLLGGDVMGAFNTAVEIMGGVWDSFAGHVVGVATDMINRVIDVVSRGARIISDKVFDMGLAIAKLAVQTKGFFSGASDKEIGLQLAALEVISGAGKGQAAAKIAAAAGLAKFSVSQIGDRGRARAASGATRAADASAGGFARFLADLSAGLGLSPDATGGGVAGGGSGAVSAAAGSAASFSAIALQRSGGPQNRTAKATEKTATLLETIKEEVTDLGGKIAAEIGFG